MTEKLSPSMPSDSLKSECLKSECLKSDRLKSDRLIVSTSSNLKSQTSPFGTFGTTFPPQFGGAAKGKRLNGQARRLTSPHLEVLCRTSTVTQQNAPSFRAKRSGAPKSPRTMALAVSRGYVSRRNASLTSDRLTSSLSLSLLPQISYLKSQISFLPLPQL